MMQQARIDVLIPAYNAEATVEEAIGSIQRQTVRDIRIIVVNDGSSDGTGTRLHAMAASDPNLVVIDTPNRGIVAALNHALSEATAPIIARHDADDIAFPDRFERQLAYLDAHPDCIALGADAHHIDADGRRTGYTTAFGGPVRWNAGALPALEPYLMHPFLMMRREAIVAAGGYRYVFHAEDADLYWQLLSQGRLHNLPDVLGEYRVHAGSVSSVSVHNGRVAAVYAELAAMSFQRREAGVPDLTFPAEAREALKSLGTIDAIVDYAAQAMTDAEQEHFRLAVAAKLLQNATYRPYLLDLDDCRFIAHATPGLLARLDRQGRRKLTRDRAAVLWRLLRKQRHAEADALAVPRLQYALLTPIFFRQAQVKLRQIADKRRA